MSSCSGPGSILLVGVNERGAEESTVGKGEGGLQKCLSSGGQLTSEAPPSPASLKQIKTSKMQKLKFLKSLVMLKKGNVCNPLISLTKEWLTRSSFSSLFFLHPRLKKEQPLRENYLKEPKRNLLPPSARLLA